MAAGINEIIMLFSVGLFLICPAIAIVKFCVYLVSNNKPRRKWFAWVLLGLWLVSIAGCCITGCNTYNHRNDSNFIWNSLSNWDFDDDDYANINYLSQVRNADEQKFHTIDVEDAVTVIFTQGDPCSITVNAPDNKIDKVRTDIRNGVLYIRNKNTILKGGEHIEVLVTAPNMDKIVISDACDFKLDGPVSLPKLDVELSDASAATLYGHIDTLNIKAEGASGADLKSVKSKVVLIKAEEASEVNAGEARDLRIISKGGSEVTYKGDPRVWWSREEDFQ